MSIILLITVCIVLAFPRRGGRLGLRQLSLKGSLQAGARGAHLEVFPLVPVDTNGIPVCSLQQESYLLWAESLGSAMLPGIVSAIAPDMVSVMMFLWQKGTIHRAWQSIV